MMIRKFKVGGAVYDGFYLPDGSGDIQCLTERGPQIFFEWEFELIA